MSLTTEARRRLWLITGLFAALLVWWATITPPTFGPDEYKHVDLVRGVAATRSYPAYDERQVSHQMLEALRTIPFDGNLTQAQARPRPDRPTLRDFGDDGPTERRNHIAAHPPLFYVVVGLPFAVIGPMLSHLSFDWTFLTMRLLSLSLLLPLPFLTYAIARRVRLDAAVATTAALLPLAVPNLVFVSATVNNDTLLITLVTAAMLGAVRVATGDTSQRTAVWFGAAIGAALLTKAFAWVLIPAAVGAYLLGSRNGRLARLAVTLGVSFAFGGWWFVRNLIVYGNLQPTVGLNPNAPSSFRPSFSTWFGEFLPMFTTSFWARFGNAAGEARLVSILGWAVVLLGVGAAVVGRRRGLRVWHTALLLLPAVVLVAFVAVGSWASYVRADAFGAMKGRYLNAGVAPLMVVVAAGLSWFVRERALPFVAFIAIVALHAWSLVVVLSHYWGPPHTSAFTRMGALVAWSPLPTALLFAVWAAVATTVVVNGRALLRLAR